jgi:predicted Zn-dependent peptidase
VRHVDRDEQQLYLALGAPVVPYGDPRRFALYVLNTLLGGFMSSRLFQRIREEAGLAYSVASNLGLGYDSGLFGVEMNVAPERGREALRLLSEELVRIVAEGPSQAEVEAARMYLKGDVVLGMESVAHRMRQLARQELHTGTYVGPEERIARIMSVTREQVAAVAAEFLRPGRFTLTALGPVSGTPITETDWPLEAAGA